MELSFAFLALYADYTDDKSLWVAGADFERLAIGVPAGITAIAQFSLVAKFRVSPAESAVPHFMRIECAGPTGQRVSLNQNEQIPTKANEQYPDRSSGAVVIAKIGMGFKSPGEYTFYLVVDDKEVKSIPLMVELPATPVKED